MRTLFVDAVYWIALLNPRDNLHAQTVLLSRSLESDQTTLVTTEMVLTELLNAFAERGAASAVPQQSWLADSGRMETLGSFLKPTRNLRYALQLYRSRNDKE
jgi:hypothetical protein